MQSLIEIQPNMAVFTADAVLIGRVKEIHEDAMLVDRTRERDIFIPYTYVDRVIDTEKRVELSLTEDVYDEHDWEQPSVL